MYKTTPFDQNRAHYSTSGKTLRHNVVDETVLRCASPGSARSRFAVVPRGLSRFALRAPVLAPVLTPAAHRGDSGLEAAAPARGRVGAGETRIQLGEHPLAAGLGCVVSGVGQVLVRQRKLRDRAPRLAVLHQER